MKHLKIVTLLLCMVMLLCALPTTVGAAGTTGKFTAFNGSTLKITVEDADIVKAEQDGSNMGITIYLENVKNNSVKISASDANPRIVWSGDGNIPLTNGTATTQIQLKPAQNAPVMATWIVELIDTDVVGGIEKPATIKMTTDLSESEVKVTQGKTAPTLTVKAEQSKGEAVTYQWYKNSAKSTNGGTLIDGATEASYTPASYTAGTTYYYAIATCQDLSVTSKLAKITVEAPVVRFTTDLSEAEVKVTQGRIAPTLTVSAEYTGISDTLIAYQWYKNTTKSTDGGILVEGATETSYTPSSENVGTAYYYAIATCGEKSASSKIATVTIEEPTVKITTEIEEEEKFCVFGKSAPTLSVKAEYTGVTDSAITYQWYKNTEKTTEGGTAIENATEASYTPKTEAVGTTYYYAVASCEGKTAISKIATVTVSADLSPTSGLWLGIETSNGGVNYVKFTDVNGEEIDGLYAELSGTQITVALPHNYGAGEKVNAKFNLTQNGDLPFITTKTGTSGTPSGKAVNNKFTEKETTLSRGTAAFTFYLYNSNPTTNNNKFTTYTVNYAIANEIPTLADAQNTADTAEVVAGDAYTLDLSPLFTDADGDALTYSVKINGEAAVAADANYSFVPTIGGKTYTLEFFASDVMATSTETYTVSLEVINSTATYDMTVLLPSDITPAFYITSGYENGIDVLGNALEFEAGETADGITSYTVFVPENISEISVRDSAYGGMAFSAASGGSASLQKVETEIVDFSDKTISGSVEVFYGGHKALGIDGKFLLATGAEYKFSATPEKTSKYNVKTDTFVLDADISKVSAKVDFKSPKTVKTTTGATAKLFKSSSHYFDYLVYEPEASIDNDDGTTTHYFAPEDTSPGVMSYRVSMKGSLTKAGYLSIVNSVSVFHSEDDKLPTDRVDYTMAGTDAAEVADDSVLLNINQQNHLSLAVGQTKTLKAYRTWQIIQNHLNHIIEPDFHFNILSGDDVVSLAPYANQPTVNASGNWQTLTAIGEGTAVVEVTYDAIDVKGGSYEGFYGAIDPARTGLFVVTVGADVPDVDFGIECKTGAGSMVYAPSNAKHWDAELDTLYFLGESGEIKLSPTLTDGNITEVAVSSDKGESYTVLEAADGVYTAPIVSGNNIIRVTTDKGVAYQVVRGDKIELVVKNETRPDTPIAAGDKVSLSLVGVHTPIPKFSGTYNPGYKNNDDGDGSVHLNYTFGENTVKNEGAQYTFSKYGTTVKFTVPEDSEKKEFTLTDGYIGLGVIGVTAFPDDGMSHRNISDADGGTRGDTTTFHTRSMLPDIMVSIGMLPSGNTAPFIREKAPKNATINLGGTYALGMSQIFADRDGDALTYTAKVGEGEATSVADGYYTFTPDAIGTYTITFVANDGRADSDAHTVTLTVKEKQTSGQPTLKFDLDEEDIVGYVKVSFEDKGKRVEGEASVKYPKALGTVISAKRVPFAEGDTVADVTIRLLDALGYTYEHSGTTKSGFYLASIGGFTLKGIDYDSFGEFDAGNGSGWMITLNKEFIEYGASDFEVKNGDTVKWQYTCQLGADIGDPFYSDTSSASKPKEEKKEDTKKFTFTKDTYSDVSADAWYYEAAKYTYEYGLMQGADGKFDADGEMTRAMLVTVLYRLDGENKVDKASGFADVPENEWYADAVAWAKENGLVFGISESEFAPDVNITREQLMAVIFRYAKFKGLDTDGRANLVGYMDSDEISDYAAEAFAWMVSEKLIGGTSEFTLSPKDVATRGHIAKIAMNVREMTK